MPLPLHHLDRSELAFAIDPAAPPRLTVTPPCEVMIETHNSRSGKLHRPEDEEATRPSYADRFPRTNPATGPVRVMGAEPGDALVVEILRIDLDDLGYVMVKPDAGLLQGLTNDTLTKMLPVIEGQVHFDALRLPVRPMIGVMATAPAEAAIGTAYIGRHGGNMDNNRVTTGTIVHLPVRVPGAAFFVGDLHATMGDGEMSGSGVEIGGRVHLRFGVAKGAATEWPWMETAHHWITTASAPAFDDAAEIATRSMISLLSARLGVSAAEAFALLTIAGDLRVNQLCRMQIGASARVEFPKLNAGFTRS